MSTANPRMAGLAPDEVECLHAAARAIRNRTPAQAQGLLDEVLARHPGHAEALRLLAIHYRWEMPKFVYHDEVH